MSPHLHFQDRKCLKCDGNRRVWKFLTLLSCTKSIGCKGHPALLNCDILTVASRSQMPKRFLSGSFQVHNANPDLYVASWSEALATKLKNKRKGRAYGNNVFENAKDNAIDNGQSRTKRDL